MLSGRFLHAGDRITLVNGKNGPGIQATAKEVNGAHIKLDRPIPELLAAIGHHGSEGLTDVFLYCDSQSNEDFVYRRNRHIGGRAHGVKFNGTRAWITGNHFENLNGNAVLAGYTSEVSGHGAHDVVVSDNTIVHCGWTPISIWSTSGLGSNIVIRGNRIYETRDAAIAIKGCNGVTVINNEFNSSTPPRLGAWITAQKTANLYTSGNKYSAEVPELKTAQ
jgi:parallel beta-helix repeat protein